MPLESKHRVSAERSLAGSGAGVLSLGERPLYPVKMMSDPGERMHASQERAKRHNDQNNPKEARNHTANHHSA
jgi:hypothetical protein